MARCQPSIQALALKLQELARPPGDVGRGRVAEDEALAAGLVEVLQGDAELGDGFDSESADSLGVFCEWEKERQFTRTGSEMFL